MALRQRQRGAGTRKRQKARYCSRKGMQARCAKVVAVPCVVTAVAEGRAASAGVRAAARWQR